MSETPPEFEPIPEGEAVPAPVQGGTDSPAPDLSGLAGQYENDTEYRDPLSEEGDD